jgi:hypothetical protein
MIWLDESPAAAIAFARYGASNSVQRVDETVSGRIAATEPVPLAASGFSAFIAENDVLKSAEVRFLYVTAGVFVVGLAFAAAKLVSLANNEPVIATDRMHANATLLFSRDILLPLSLFSLT